MADIKCDLCRNPKPGESLTSFETTPEERATMKRMGETEPREVYSYCRACIRLLANPEKAHNFMKGLVEFQARASGFDESAATRAAGEFAKKLKDQKK